MENPQSVRADFHEVTHVIGLKAVTTLFDEAVTHGFRAAKNLM